MRLVNVLALTNGLLVNQPFVSNFTNVVFEAKSVKRGDLFMAFDKTSIEDAISNGAYGIIYDKPTKITDKEIAWIKVDDVEDALRRLLRFELMEKKVKAYSANAIVVKFALNMMIDPKLIIVSGSIQNVYKLLWSIEENSTVLFSPTLCDSTIFTDILAMPEKENLISITEQTLFETSFVYKERFYERQMIAPVFISFLEELLTLLNILNVEFRFRKFTQIDNFEPTFINSKYQIKEFGSTQRVVIFEKDLSLIDLESKFLIKNASWANNIILVPYSMKEKVSLYSKIYSYKTKKGILKLLQKHSFNFALVFGSDNSILEQSIQTQTQLTLDF